MLVRLVSLPLHNHLDFRTREESRTLRYPLQDPEVDQKEDGGVDGA